MSHSGEIVGRLALLAGLLAASLSPARAQQVVANGTEMTASGTIDTGMRGPTAGYALYGLNGGTITSSAPLTLITGGSAAFGAAALSGGQITVATGSTITTAGGSAYGLYASGTKSLVSAAHTAITTTGDSGGIHATQAGTIILAGGSIDARRVTAGLAALMAFGGGASVEASDVTVTANGSDGYGAQANTDGSVKLTGGSVTTTGPNGNGIYTIGTSAYLSADGTSVSTSGTGAIGALALGGTMTLKSVVIETTGRSSSGAAAQFGTRISLSGGSVTTKGNSSHGLFSVGLDGTTGASLTAKGVSVDTSGTSAHGAAVRGGSTMAIEDGSRVTTSGAGSAALYSQPYDANPSTATVTGSTLTSRQGAGIHVFGTTLNASLTNSSLSGAAGAWTVANNGDGAAILHLLAEGSTLTGAALKPLHDGLAVADITLLNGTRWTVTGDSIVTQLTDTASTIAFAAPAGDPALASGYKILTVDGGNYIGQNGTISMNAYLGADASPSDMLVLDGSTATATGATTLNIVNAQGLGALTTGDGILVVDARNGASTTADAFALANDSISAGGYTYKLYRGSPSAPDSWFLRSLPATAAMPSPVAVPALSVPMLALLAVVLAGGAALRRGRTG